MQTLNNTIKHGVRTATKQVFGIETIAKDPLYRPETTKPIQDQTQSFATPIVNKTTLFRQVPVTYMETLIPLLEAMPNR